MFQVILQLKSLPKNFTSHSRIHSQLHHKQSQVLNAKDIKDRSHRVICADHGGVSAGDNHFTANIVYEGVCLIGVAFSRRKQTLRSRH